MKSKPIIFTQASFKSKLSAMMAIMLVTSLATNSELLMTSAHAVPTTSIIKPSEESVVNTASNSNVASAGLVTDIFNDNSSSTFNKPVKTLASTQIPSESELSQANQSLLTENARLQREVNTLDSHVNVLIAERSGQIFLYGAGTAIASFLIGVLLSLLLVGIRRNNRY